MARTTRVQCRSLFNTGALGAPSTITISSGNISMPLPDEGTADVPIMVAGYRCDNRRERKSPFEPYFRW